MAGPKPETSRTHEVPELPEMFLVKVISLDKCGLYGHIKEVVQKASLGIYRKEHYKGTLWLCDLSSVAWGRDRGL